MEQADDLRQAQKDAAFREERLEAERRERESYALERERQRREEARVELEREEERQREEDASSAFIGRQRSSNVGRAADDLIAALGLVKIADTAGAERLVRRALEIAPHYPWAHLFLARLLAVRGQPNAEHVEKAANLALRVGVGAFPIHLPHEDLGPWRQQHPYQADYAPFLAEVASFLLAVRDLGPEARPQIDRLIHGGERLYPLGRPIPVGWFSETQGHTLNDQERAYGNDYNEFALFVLAHESGVAAHAYVERQSQNQGLAWPGEGYLPVAQLDSRLAIALSVAARYGDEPGARALVEQRVERIGRRAAHSARGDLAHLHELVRSDLTSLRALIPISFPHLQTYVDTALIEANARAMARFATWQKDAPWMAGSPAQARVSRPGLHPTAWVVLVMIVLLLAGVVAVVRRARTDSAPVAVGTPVRSAKTVRPTAPSSVVLTPTTVAASSFLNRGGEHHPPQHAFDHNPRTAWNDSVSDTHSGQWIEAAFDGARRIDSVTLATGWNATSRHGRDLFVANAHLRRVRLVFDGGITRDANVAEGQRELTVDAHGVTSSRVRIVALDVWPGSQYNDLCISDVSVVGR